MKWQIFIFSLALAFVAIEANRNPLERIKRSVDNVHTMVLNERLRLPLIDQNSRHKRQVGWRSVDNEYDDASTCLLNCAIQLQRASLQYKNHEDGSGSSSNANRLLKPAFNLTRLSNMCQAMRPPVQCFDRCPASATKALLQKTLEPIRFICIDRYQDFLNNLRCMHKLDTTTASQCSPRCRRYEAAVNRTVQLGRQPSLRYLYSSSELQAMISGTCQWVQCFMDCSVPMIRSVCGTTAADLSTGLIQRMFASADNSAQISNGGQSILPASCRRLAQPIGTTQVVDEDVDTFTFGERNRNQNRGYDGDDILDQSTED